jgi:hypothetical protein
MEPYTAFETLHTFRNLLYECFVFPSPVHPSLEPTHRRGSGVASTLR